MDTNSKAWQVDGTTVFILDDFGRGPENAVTLQVSARRNHATNPNYEKLAREVAEFVASLLNKERAKPCTACVEKLQHADEVLHQATLASSEARLTALQEEQFELDSEKWDNRELGADPEFARVASPEETVAVNIALFGSPERGPRGPDVRGLTPEEQVLYSAFERALQNEQRYYELRDLLGPALLAFAGIHDTPIARRQHSDEYSEDARQRMREIAATLRLHAEADKTQSRQQP